MRNILALLLVLIFTSVKAQDKVIELIPKPVEMKQMTGSFTLTNNATISYNNPDVQKVADMLAENLNTPTGFSIKTIDGNTGTIQLNLTEHTLHSKCRGSDPD